jgi:hypothetical protein
MAYGELLGASCFVCMFVIGSVGGLDPSEPMMANTAVARDIGGLLLLAGLLVPTLLNGLSVTSMLLLLCTYLALTGKSRCSSCFACLQTSLAAVCGVLLARGPFRLPVALILRLALVLQRLEFSSGAVHIHA